jgi:hypothetical protein
MSPPRRSSVSRRAAVSLGALARKLRYPAIALLVTALAAGSAYALVREDGQGGEVTAVRAERPPAKQPSEQEPSGEQPSEDQAPEEQPPEEQAPEEQPDEVDESPDDGSREGSDDQSAYLQEERCQPMDDMNDPSDGVVPSPEELLPDPNECPEFYEGQGSGTAAPPVSGVPRVPSYPPSGEPVSPSYNPCAETASLNGFPCTPTPYGPVYITPDP